jgi:membrane protease YdiL (CAAX protease family)
MTSTFFSLHLNSSALKLLYFYLWWLVPTIFALGVIFRFNSITETIGLKKGVWKALLFSLITVSPMLISSAVIGRINYDLTAFQLLHKTILAGFMEEYLFRGFLFGVLFLKLGWGFIPSSLLGALIFGLGHIYQGNNLAESLGVFLVTSMGAIWFAWLYAEWENNLWIPVFLHTLMNLSWLLFDVSNNALGEPLANIFRIITITLSIIITVYKNKKVGFNINSRNLIVNELS